MRLADAKLQVLGEAVIDGPSNLQVRDGDSAYEIVHNLTEDVFADAGLDVSEASRASACLGMAGARLPEARDAFASRAFPFANIKVLDDIDIARAGAHGEDDGGVIIIGTGSAVMALVDGRRLQAGGWGYHVGDQMSAAILGRELLRRSLLAHDGIIPATALSKAVMAEFDNEGSEMMGWSFDNEDARATLQSSLEPGQEITHLVPAPPGKYGQFAKMVTDYFEQGDPLAKELMDFEMDLIGLHINWLKSEGVKSIAIVGGLGRHLLPQIRERFGEIVIEKEPNPLHGALILARQYFGS